MSKLILPALFICFLFQHVNAQKKYINRKVAQKNYDGYMLMQDKNYKAALSIFNEAISDDPEAFFIYQNRAICKLHLKDTLGAIADYQTNIKLEPNNAETKYALGNIFKYQKDSLNAVANFVPAIQQADNEFSQKKLLYMNNFCGHYFRLQEDYDSALVFYHQVQKYTPQNASVYINSAVCHFHLDSLGKFCSMLEKAFVLGGDVNCIALKAYCSGCNHLIAERGGVDTLSHALDTRLAGIIPDTIYYQAKYNAMVERYNTDRSKKVKVYYNKLWQMCLPKDASYYREAFWSGLVNFYGGDFTDYYINGQIYAKGRVEKKQLVGKYQVYYPNGNLKLDAEFANGAPVGKWTSFLQNGTADYEIRFTMENFKLHFLNQANPNYSLNSGSGKFSILLDKWDDIKFEFYGEYANHAREGSWGYKQAGQKIIAEKYKKGKFKSGYVSTARGNISSTVSCIEAHIFMPPQLTQVSNLFFDTVESANHYAFIQKFGF